MFSVTSASLWFDRFSPFRARRASPPQMTPGHPARMKRKTTCCLNFAYMVAQMFKSS
jgi:hypothetical protein